MLARLEQRRGPAIGAAVRPERRAMTLDVAVRAARGGFTLDATFAVAAGETVAVLGPNGAGKSTLLAVLAGILRPGAGTLRLGDVVWNDVAGGVHAPPQARAIGMVFQDLMLFPHLSALENVAFPLRARGAPVADARARAALALERLGVAERADARPAALSGGEAQRVALARALVGEPRLLLLDEPLSALDVAARGRSRAILRQVLATFDGSALLVTHDAVDAATLADRAIVIEGGRIVQDATLDAVRRHPRSAFAAELMGVNVFRGRLEPLPDGAGRLGTSEGQIVVAWPPDVARVPVDVVATVDPSDVTLHLAPMASSARNSVHGRIIAVHRDGDRVRVHLDAAPPIQAELTSASLDRLGLAEGVAVWASFKAAAVRLVLD